MGTSTGFEPEFPAAWCGVRDSNPRLEIGNLLSWPLDEPSEIWSGIRESNPCVLLGRQMPSR